VDDGKAGPAAFQDKYFPNADGTLGRILFTVRSDDSSGHTHEFGEITAIEVQKLDPNAATEMFKTKTGPYFSKDAARELVTDYFDGLPLAIASAAGVIKESRTQAQAYLTNLKRRTRGLDSVRDIVFLVLRSALEYARKNDSACRVLDIAAFLNPDRIEKKLLVQNSDDTTIGLLCSLCLFQRLDDSGDTYSIHRLHQDAAREGRSPVDAIMAVKKGFAVFKYRDSSTWNSGLEMHVHAEALTSYVEKMGDSYLNNNENQIDYATILRCIGLVLQVFQYFREALVKEENALKVQRHVYGENAKNADLAEILKNLGAVHRDLGNYDVARANFEKALEMMRHVYGENTENVALAETLNNLGLVHHDLGNKEEARANFEKALEMQRRVYGENTKNADLADTLNNLGLVDLNLGNYEEALANFEKALEMMQHVHGENAENVALAETLRYLGLVDSYLCNYDVARAIFEKALEMMRHVYGENAENDALVTALRRLGKLYFYLGNYDAAGANFEKALEMIRHVHGENAENAEFAVLLRSLGLVDRDLRNYKVAARISRKHSR
jgi:tetratricopeptide (TPR) repeat protein